MGVALFHGRGTEADQHKAIQVMESAGAQGHVDAMIFLGDWFISENNANPEPGVSIEYYRRAAALRSNEGRMKLGLSYIKGRGVMAPERLSTDYLDNFNAIWELQSYLMAEADKHNLPIVSNIHKENAIQEVMKAVNDTLLPHFSHDLHKVFPDET